MITGCHTIIYLVTQNSSTEKIKGESCYFDPTTEPGRDETQRYIPECIQEVQVEVLGGVPRVGLEGPEIDLFLAVRAHVLLADQAPAADTLLVELVSTVQLDARLHGCTVE
jgi:hypothetical protein